jgi:hypothetical protein
MSVTMPNGSYQSEELHQSAISVYEVEIPKSENNAHREVKIDNIGNHSLNTDFNAQQASMEVMEQDKVTAIAPKPKDGIYELCRPEGRERAKMAI